MRTAFIAIATATAVLATPALAAVAVVAGTSEGSTTDPLNGATVTANSALLGGFSVQDAFGAVTPGGPYPESQAGGHVIFADGSQTNFITFNTAASVLLQGVNVFVSSDGVNNPDRQFAQITLFAGTTANNLTSLGTGVLGTGGQTVSYSFAPTQYQYFRFEGTNLTNGARLLEIDGIAGVPEPATWAMMIMGFGMVGGALRHRRRSATAALA